ncbi:DNA-directed RNA polymerase subunit beta' [Mesomycoplasma lagogenitalium]|uniref:DNA-directed RNA polymerase subunit beta' n=2 Tax=Mesomycoplasma lagogenitalium TaxID=171286 RepID=A0ABY8LSS7_9BACT|nr:DNA-directed RNA polymerase subunit beta' [Mesomycoplasma lagogenitalium]WGI36309.1 DNA-directed RNA polymerase subunit beta' [Mesomycoplasma lagogenitalium]
MNKNKNNKITRKYATIDENSIDKISLSLATSEDVLEWSNGEVTKAETINYKTFKPEREGLFDELIFGPVIDYKCSICGRKYKKSNEGTNCSATELCKSSKSEILPKISRRSRMGHIALNSPVVHFWFFRIDHSIISKLLGIKTEDSNKAVSKSSLESLIYYKAHIILESGGIKALPKNQIIELNEAGVIYKDALLEIREKYEPDTEEYEELSEALKDLSERATSKLGKEYGIDFYELNEIIEEYSDAKISTGAEAIKYLLSNINLEEERDKIKTLVDEIQNLSPEKKTSTKIQERDKLYKRLQVINSFINSGQDPLSMLITNLPVIPADLRPLIQLDGGRHSTSDINELYRRIIIRNNRLKKWYENDAPILIIQNELRMIQEAVDALIDNQRRSPAPISAKDGRPLKSISDALTGKKGRFRQNLLGKRVDYSGRSVIVVGPNLKMHQVGIPREMAAKLFEPWIIRRLIEQELSSSIKSARKMIEELNPIIWPHVAKVIEGKLVLLNRAPSLHRLSIRAFEPVLVRGRAIKLHPLVTAGFNADFDGDQMAVHVPISPEAIRETRELMFANKNILGPKDGEPIVNPSQDMILGLYYLTKEDKSEKGRKGEGRFFGTYNEMLRAHEVGAVSLHARVALPFSEVKKSIEISSNGYIISTVGKFIFNNAFPENFPFVFDTDVDNLYLNQENQIAKYVAPKGTNLAEFIKQLPFNEPLNKKHIAKIIRQTYDNFDIVVSMEDVASVVKELNFDNYKNSLELYSKLIDYKNEKISAKHATNLAKFTVEEFENIYKKIKISNHNIDRELEKEEKVTLLEKIWFKYTNLVAEILDEIKDLGFKYSMLSGTSISIGDIKLAPKKDEFILEGEKYTAELNDFFKMGMLTDDERYILTIDKWTKIKDEIQKDLNNVTNNEPDNPIFMMMKSGARGNISNFVQLAGMRGLMANNVKTLKADAENERVVRSTVEVPVKSSFLEGLTSYEFYSSTHGARKGGTDTALNTAKSGYLTRRLVDVAQNIVVTQSDCGSDFGFVVKEIIDTKTNSSIVSLFERIEGRYTNSPIYHPESGELIVNSNKFITPEIAKEIVDAGIKEVEIRSILSCHTRNGVCKKCYGKDLATNRIVAIGEAVGIIAAQSIGEPGTQLTMRTFHTGGVAGVEDITGGFTRLIELIDAYDRPWGKPAQISPVKGYVSAIEELKDKAGNITGAILVRVKYKDNEDNELEKVFHVQPNRKLRVKLHDNIIPGQKITEGPIILKELLNFTDARRVQNYLLKEVQRLYRMQGISISDKYIEIIIRQMLSKILITDAGDSNLFVGSLVDVFEYQEVNGQLLTEGKKPAFGQIVIKGAKQTPLLSDSFLAAASYQETSKILVHASISSQVDKLEGLKENIIVGHRIPAGTNSKYEPKSKYDIQDPINYFKD